MDAIPLPLDGLQQDIWRPLELAAGAMGFQRMLGGEAERIEVEVDWVAARNLARRLDRRTSSDPGYIAKAVLGLGLREHAPRSFAMLPGNGGGTGIVVGWRLTDRSPSTNPDGSPLEPDRQASEALGPVRARIVRFCTGHYRVRTLCVAQIRQGWRAGEGGSPDRKRSWRYPGLLAGQVRERPDPGLRDFEAASWIWHRLARPGLSPVRIGDIGEPTIQADQVVKQLHKEQAEGRRVMGLLMRHCVLDATVDVTDPGALALLALSRLGSAKFSGYGMTHVEPVGSAGAAADDETRTGGLPSVLGLMEGRELAQAEGQDRVT